MKNKIKKIRGHKRRWKDITNWVSYNKKLDLELLKDYEEEVLKIRINPWGNLNVVNSQIPNPKGKTKRLIIKGLIEIYSEWKIQLETLKEPYFLQLILVEDNFIKSYIICSIGEKIDFYKNLYYKPKSEKSFPFEKFKFFENELKEFHWEYRIDELSVLKSDFEAEDDNEMKKWYEKNISKSHREYKTEGNGIIYFTKIDNVWIGMK